VEEAIALADELEWVMSQLSELARRVLELRLGGAQLSEISDDTGRSERTVRRILGQVRHLIMDRLDNA
jgi:DNA-directed RNA polymerase specialized sigma24 family protein